MRVKLQADMIVFSVIFLPLISGSLESCEEHGAIVYIDTAKEMIENAKLKFLETLKHKTTNDYKPVDCYDLHKRGHNKSTTYTVWPHSRLLSESPIKVYCDMHTDGGGWTVIQRRGNFSNPDTYFDKSWKEYKTGFGNVEADFWLGNDIIFALTHQRLCSIRFDLEDRKGAIASAKYEMFWIDDEYNKYRLHISGFSGNAGDGMAVHNDMMFTTSDTDNDRNPNGNCGATYKSGWWFNNCYDGYSSLNGVYNARTNGGIDWMPFRWEESLRWTEIKIRPRLP